MKPVTSSNESGSLPLVLLAAIILAGVIVALFVTVSTGVDTAQRDRDWHSAVQVADAGLQHAFVQLRDLPEGETAIACDSNEDGTCEGDLGQTGSYTFTYEQDAGSETQWVACSRGEFGESERQVCGQIGPRQLFPAAMVAKSTLTYNGGGGGNPPFTVGSFGSITLNGVPANDSVASIITYGTGPHTISASGQPITNAANWEPQDLDDMYDGAVAAAGCTDVDYDVYPSSVVAEGETPGVRGETYCVGRVDFNASSHSLSGPSGQAVRIFVLNPGTNDAVRVRTQAAVNWPGALPGEPEEHLIFVESGAVRFSANSEFSGGIFAPNSNCDASGNQDIVGSLICNSITVGGTFGFGAGLSEETEGPFRINRFWEGSDGA